MSDLFEVGHLETRLEHYRFGPSSYGDAHCSTCWQPLAGDEDIDAIPDGYPWVVARLADAAESTLEAVIKSHLGFLHTKAPSVREALRCFESGTDPAAALVRGCHEDDLMALSQLLHLASMLHQVHPDRFAPLTLARVLIDVDGIHPDVRRFEVNSIRAARLLRDSSDTHPLRRFEDGDALMDAVAAVESQRTRITDEELRSGSTPEELIAECEFYRCECVVWLPPSFVGEIHGRFWRSAASDD